MTGPQPPSPAASFAEACGRLSAAMRKVAEAFGGLSPEAQQALRREALRPIPDRSVRYHRIGRWL